MKDQFERQLCEDKLKVFRLKLKYSKHLNLYLNIIKPWMKRYNNLSKDYFHIFYSFFVKVRERLKVEIEKNTQLKDELERTKNEVIIIIQP